MRVGETLTVDISSIADENGLNNIDLLSYQWLAGDSEIQGATASTHTLIDSDEGQTIRVRVTFTDDDGPRGDH